MKAANVPVWLKWLLCLGIGWIILWAVLPAGSIPALIERINAPPQHIVMSNSEGHAVDPTGNFFCQDGSRLCFGRHVPIWLADYDELGQDGRPSYDDYLSRLFAKLREHSDEQNNGKRKVLIFVHGGLNSQRGAVRRAARLFEFIKDSPEHYYPIFINWDSSFFSGYYDYLVHIRQGEYYRSWHWKAWLLAPFYFIADMGRGILQAPMLWLNELSKIELREWLQENVSKSTPMLLGAGIEQHSYRVGRELRNAYDANPNGEVIAISEGKDQQKFWPEQFLSGVTWLNPVRIVSGPILEALGESSTHMNQRRTRMLFHTNKEFTDEAGGDYRDPEGAVAVFMNRLQKEFRADQALNPPRDWEITLVGHSMGTIILNEAIRRFGVDSVKTENGNYVESVLPFNHIVYMAAACTIRDYKDSVFPYLQKNGRARFYHLTLHEEAEERERVDLIPYLDLLPRGSILVWLDDFLANPVTYLDRTLGSYANLMLTVQDTPNRLRRQISIKAFDAGATVSAPQVHGDFVGKFMFWKEDCWKPRDQVQPECFNARGHY